MSYLNFERQPSSIAAVGIANGMMVSCNKLRSGFENVGSVTGTFYPPVASPHDQSLQHYTSTQSSKTANYSMQSSVESNYNPVQCANRQQSMGIRGAAEGCSGNPLFLLVCPVTLGINPMIDYTQLECCYYIFNFSHEYIYHLILFKRKRNTNLNSFSIHFSFQLSLPTLSFLKFTPLNISLLLEHSSP